MFSSLLSSNPNNVFLGSKVGAYHWSKDMITLKVPGTWTDMLAYALPKDSELTGFFNYQILRMRESGLLDYLIRKWISGGVTSSHTSHFQPDWGAERGSGSKAG